MNLQAVIFDLDGTLIDSMNVWMEVDKEFLKKRGIIAPDDIFDDVAGGNSFPEIAAHFKQKFSLPESIESIMQEWTHMVKYHYENTIELKKNVMDTLNLLAENNIKMGVGTSNSLQLTKSILQKNQVISFFDSIVNGDDNCRGKPYPDIFLKVASELQVSPENCLVIEDVLVGVQAAKNAGMKVIAIADQHAFRDAIQIQREANFYYDDFDKIYTHLSRIVNKKLLE